MLTTECPLLYFGVAPQQLSSGGWIVTWSFIWVLILIGLVLLAQIDRGISGADCDLFWIVRFCVCGCWEGRKHGKSNQSLLPTCASMWRHSSGWKGGDFGRSAYLLYRLRDCIWSCGFHSWCLRYVIQFSFPSEPTPWLLHLAKYRFGFGRAMLWHICLSWKIDVEWSVSTLD